MSARPNESSGVIPSSSDEAAFAVNALAIDRLVDSQHFPHIAAWGKFLGFTPETVLKYVVAAESENAPADAIQKIDGRWLVLSDITNATNRQRVEALARPPRTIG